MALLNLKICLMVMVDFAACGYLHERITDCFPKVRRLLLFKNLKIESGILLLANYKTDRKSSNKPPGGIFNFGLSRWEDVNREEVGFFPKSSDKDIFGSFSVLLSHILRNHIQFYGSNT